MKTQKTRLQNIVFLALAMALTVAPFLIKPGAEFPGADDLAQQAIHQFQPNYTPWITPLWAPPSNEVATLLFSLQAALGAGFIGYYLGSRKNRQKKPGNDHS